MPTYARRFVISDVALNIAPDTDQKRDICQNAIGFARALGIDLPKVAVLAAGAASNLESCPQLTLSGRVPKAIVKRQQRESRMATGTVKWFNSLKGYGFIQPQAGGKDVFVHISAVERAGLSGLAEGQVVEYEEVADKGKTSAQNLKVQR